MPEKHELNRQADELLERALARYAGEPLSGLENRTLARLRAHEEAAARSFFSRTRWTRRLAAVATAAAAAAASLLVGMQIGQHRADAIWQQRVANGVWNAVKPAGTATVLPIEPAARTETTAKTSHPSSRQIQAAVGRKPSVSGSKVKTSDVAAQFPSPLPLTPQEKALERLAASGNPALLSSLAELTKQDNAVQHNDTETRPPQ